MASDKRDFSDFSNFPGVIKDGRYQFPTLHHIDGNDNHRIWKIQIRFIKTDSKKQNYPYGWSVNSENQIPISKEHLLGDYPEGTLTQMWTESGIIDGKITVHPPTFTEEKNKGKADERTPFQTALIDGRAKFLNKKERGGMLKEEFKKNKKVKDHMFYPMLLRKWDDEKKHIKFPAIVQPKLDGTRIVGFLSKKDGDHNNIRFYTRSKKTYTGFLHIKKKLLNALLNMWDGESLYIDGEFYKHGKSLQEISGMVRNEEETKKVSSNGVKLHLFDCFYPSKLKMTTIKRQALLDKLFSYIDSGWIKRVKNYNVNNESELMDKYKYFIRKKYEGAVVRNLDGEYLAHPTLNNASLRSRNALKLKKRYSMELPVYDFTQGDKGKDVGAILWIFKINDKILTLQPKNITYKERYELYKDAKKNFKTKYKGRLMTIDYEDLSNDGIPLRAKAVGFRDLD